MDRGRGKPDRVELGLAFYYPWKDMEIESFDDWSNPERHIDATDLGDDWQKDGMARRYHVVLSGMFSALPMYLYRLKNKKKERKPLVYINPKKSIDVPEEKQKIPNWFVPPSNQNPRLTDKEGPNARR